MLRLAGWGAHRGRAIVRYARIYESLGLTCPPNVAALLEEFGGLRIRSLRLLPMKRWFRPAGRFYEHSHFKLIDFSTLIVDPGFVLSMVTPADLRRLAELAGTTLYPFAWPKRYHDVLLADEQGRIYIAFFTDWLVRLECTWREVIEAFIKGGFHALFELEKTTIVG